MMNFHHIVLLGEGAIRSSLSDPLPWLLLLLGLWLAYMMKGLKLAAKIRESRKTNALLSNQLRTAMDKQSKTLDFVSRTYQSEKRRWSLQVANRNQLLTDLNCRIARMEEETGPSVDKDTADRYIDLENRINELEIENARLTETVSTLDSELSEKQGVGHRLDAADSEIARRDAELNHLREEREGIRSSLEAKIAELQSDIDAKNGALDESKRQHAALDSSIREMESVITGKDETIAGLEKSLEENEGARRRVAELENEIRSLDESLAGKEAQIYQLQSHPDDQGGWGDRILALSGFLAQSNGDNGSDTLQTLAARGDSEGLFAHLEDTVKTRQDQLHHLQTEIRVKDDTIETLRNEFQQAEWYLGERDEQLRVAENRIQELQDKFDSENKGTDTRVRDLERLLSERDEELAGLRFEKEGLTFELSERVNEIASLHSNHDKPQNLQPRVDELESILRDLEKELVEQKNSNRELEEKLSGHPDQSRVAELEWLLGEREGQLEDLRNDMWAREHHQGERIAELEWLMGERDAELERLRGEKQTIEEQLNKMQNSDTQKEHPELVSRIQELEWLMGERDADLQNLRNENGHLQSVIAEKDRQLAALHNDHSKQHRIDELEWLLGERDGELHRLRQEKEELQKQNHDQQETISGLKRHQQEKDDWFHRESEQLRATLQSTEQELKTFEGEDVQDDPEIGVIYRSAPEDKDDLRKIRGVADVLEAKLHQLGIYQYKQIAGWTSEQIAKVGEKLAFKDRIERDFWVHQAIDLHREKYGENLAPQIQLFPKTKTATKATRKNTPESKKAVSIPTYDAFEDDPVKMDRLLGPVFTSRPKEVDDLSKLEGITGRFVEMLNNFGVYRYKQIALWNTRHLKQFSLLLNVNSPERVDISHWVAEANQLHRQKYNETLQ